MPGWVCVRVDAHPYRKAHERVHARTHTQALQQHWKEQQQQSLQQFGMKNKDISSRQKQLLAVAMTT